MIIGDYEGDEMTGKKNKKKPTKTESKKKKKETVV